jgi:hypothetical protein
MGKQKLRLYANAAGRPQEPSVKLKVRDVFPLLVHAHRHNSAWLKDLADDEMVVTADLAEVLAAYAELVDQKKPA